MNYKDLLLSHLAQYRRDVLNVPGPGIFKFRGREVPVEQILPKDQPWLGIPVEARDTVKEYVEAHGVRLHQYFHHLNSSQAFALSLFVPFFEGGSEASTALLRAVGIDGNLVSWAAEAVPDPAEGTNLDASWMHLSTSQVYLRSQADGGRIWRRGQRRSASKETQGHLRATPSRSRPR